MVDRDAVLSDEKIGVSNDLVPHRVWVRWMKQCITERKRIRRDSEGSQSGIPWSPRIRTRRTSP